MISIKFRDATTGKVARRRVAKTESVTRVINDMILTKHFRIGAEVKLSEAEKFLKRKWEEIERQLDLAKKAATSEGNRLPQILKILNKVGNGIGASNV